MGGTGKAVGPIKGWIEVSVASINPCVTASLVRQLQTYGDEENKVYLRNKSSKKSTILLSKLCMT